MSMINVEQLLQSKYPAFSRKPDLITRPALAFLKRLLRERELNTLFAQCDALEGLDFVDKVLEDFNFGYSVIGREKENIPVEGRVVIVANHPLGILDGLALIKLVSEVRRDVRIVANDVLLQVKPLQSLLLPVVNLGRGSNRANIDAINAALANEEAVIVFPGGDVSRVGPTGIKDGLWHGGFLRFAERAEAPVLPVHLDGKNSALFYTLSTIFKPLSTLMLVREMYEQKAMTMPIRVGELIPWQEIAGLDVPREEKIKRISQHVYGVNSNRVAALKTQRSIAHPESTINVRKELQEAELLGETKDGKQIYVFDHRNNSPVMREIGRLREATFRRVGEGTGLRRDLDIYDTYYRQLVLWDDNDLQIAGAYRIAEVGDVIATRGVEGLYSNSLFSFSEKLQSEGVLAQTLEMGRSFVQPRYWGMRSLDYLWFGIGAYVMRHPNIRYLLGPVSISDTYPRDAKNMLVHFYRHYFGDENLLALARHRWVISEQDRAALASVFAGDNYEQDFRTLRQELGKTGLSVPVLYKQYTETYEAGGVKFLDFNIDQKFSNCVDGLVLADLDKLKPAKRERYLGEKRNPLIAAQATA
ncbi:MAG: lysophospholipid acyltransferase family protein [Usitatibacteraceae bacterium]